MNEDDTREIKGHIEHWGDLFYGRVKVVTAEKLDALALQIGVLWKHLARQRSRAA
jgi:hypothetical protein